MKNTERLPKNVLSGLRVMYGQLSISDIEGKINSMTPDELWSEWLIWQGFIGYSEKIKTAHDSIFGVNPTFTTHEGNRDWCCWMLSEDEVLKAIKDTGVPESLGLELSDEDRGNFISEVVDRFKEALSIMGEEWERELRGCVNDTIEAWQDSNKRRREMYPKELECVSRKPAENGDELQF